MSGVGRGRGWLNIRYEQKAPGGIMTTMTSTKEEKDEPTKEDIIKQYLCYIDNISDIPTKYMKAFQEFETNSNAKTLLRNLADHQFSDEDIYRCISLLVQKYLVEWNMGFKVIENAYNINRKALLTSAQNIFENHDYLFKRNKLAFVKLMIMLSRIMVFTGSCVILPAVFLCGIYILEPVYNDYVPILARCLHHMYYNVHLTSLPSKQPANWRKSFINVTPSEAVTAKWNAHFTNCANEMLPALRAAICATSDATTRYWLHLVRDIIDRGCQMLPADTLEFYAKHLGEAEINYFRQMSDLEVPLYLDTNQSLHSLDKHISAVSVLKIDDSSTSQKQQNDVNVQAGASVHDVHVDRINSATSSNHHRSEPQSSSHTSDNQSPPIQAQRNNHQQQYQAQPQGGGGRAILGSGAQNKRYNKQQKQLVEGGAVSVKAEVWEPNQRDVKDRLQSGGRQPPPDLSRNHSSWNHDDRC